MIDIFGIDIFGIDIFGIDIFGIYTFWIYILWRYMFGIDIARENEGQQVQVSLNGMKT